MLIPRAPAHSLLCSARAIGLRGEAQSLAGRQADNNKLAATNRCKIREARPDKLEKKRREEKRQACAQAEIPTGKNQNAARRNMEANMSHLKR